MMEELVAALPEAYQPIFGHSELSNQSSRPCQDRLEHILAIYSVLEEFLGRPLRVLDLGCAQGFFSLSLAKQGAAVDGVDFLRENINVCNALSEENPALQVNFSLGRVEEVINSLEQDRYDLILGLSVFHHIVYEHGIDAVKLMLKHAAKKAGVLLVELALREEPLYWGAKQPDEPAKLLESIAFICEMARHGTHLTSIPRPLFVASDKFWILDGLIGKFDSWSLNSHALALGVYQSSRRYYFGSDVVLKFYRFDHSLGSVNRSELAKEVQFLQNPPSGFIAPKLITSGARDAYGWVVEQRMPGELLLDLLQKGRAIDSRAVLLSVLEQLVSLEAAELYHDDVRVWNVLVSDDGSTHLIDYGAISSRKADCVWPNDIFLSFLIFVRELISGVINNPVPLRDIYISPFGLPEPYFSWALSLWQLPLEARSFSRMYQELLLASDVGLGKHMGSSNNIWMKAIEEAVQIQKLSIADVRPWVDAKFEAQARQFEQRISDVEKRALKAETNASQAEARVFHVEAKASQAEAKACQAAAEVLRAETRIWDLTNSTSWRITSPLRWIGERVRPLRRCVKAPIKKVLLLVAGYISRRQWLNLWVLGVLNRFPYFKSRLARIMTKVEDNGVREQQREGMEQMAELPFRARQIYSSLVTEIKRQRKRGS